MAVKGRDATGAFGQAPRDPSCRREPPHAAVPRGAAQNARGAGRGAAVMERGRTTRGVCGGESVGPVIAPLAGAGS